MGACDRAPVCAVGHVQMMQATVASVAAAAAHQAHAHAYPSPLPFDAYVRAGGYSLLKACLSGARTRDDIIKAVSDAGLRGLGGAGFPTGRKWQLVRAEPAPRLFAVNADEGEPGTFKDRYYLERDPHRFIEGMLIAAWIVEAADTYIYISRRISRGAADAGRGDRQGRTGRALPSTPALHLRRGAGAYICGEESAMIELIEGKRGLPRHRPPYVAQVGLFGRPTLEQNVETLFWVRDIVEKGADWFTSHGRHERKGFRSFSVSGRVKKPGVVLAPAGVTARELIDEFCGGMADGHTFKGYLPGGASGGILPASMADLPLDFGTLEKYGCFVGSHAVVILSEQGRHESGGAQPDEVLRGRELRPMHALPRRHREGREADGERPMGRRRCSTSSPPHARRLDLRARPGGAQSAAECAKVFSGRADQAAGSW